MKSMTGYGRGDCSQDGFKITVELSSVNRKQTEISVNLPREMEMLEAPIRDVINRYVARGRLTVRVALHAGGNSANSTASDAPSNCPDPSRSIISCAPPAFFKPTNRSPRKKISGRRWGSR